MMPFSVLRTWGFGLLGWAVIAAAIYCLWEWSDGIDPVDNRQETVLASDGSRTVAAPRTDQIDNQGGWQYLASGLALLAFSGIGGISVAIMTRLLPSDRPNLPVPDSSRIIDRPDGTRLSVEFFGEKTSPALVLTHGWSLDRTAWSYVVDQLAKRYRVIVWELPGHGRSRSPSNGDFSIEKMAADLASVVEIAGNGPIVLVGHSIGGMISQTFCRLFPKLLGRRIAGIALVHTTYTNPHRTALGASIWQAIEKPVIVPLNYLTIWLAPLAWLSNMQSYASGWLHLMTRISSFAGKQTWGQLDHGSWLGAKAWPGAMARGN